MKMLKMNWKFSDIWKTFSLSQVLVFYTITAYLLRLFFDTKIEEVSKRYRTYNEEICNQTTLKIYQNALNSFGTGKGNFTVINSKNEFIKIVYQIYSGSKSFSKR